MPNRLVVPDEGLNDLLAYQIKIAISGINPWSLRLFINDYDPEPHTVLSDLTEASFTGYGAVTMTRSEWTDPVVDDSLAHSTWKTTPTSWLCTASGETVYGCYYTDDDLNVIRGVFRFDDPVDVEPGGVISVLPAFTYAWDNCSPMPPPPPPPPP